MTDQLVALIRGVPIRYFDRYAGGVVAVFPEYYWGEPTPEQRNAQLSIKRDYEEWIDLLRCILRKATDEVAGRIREADESFRIWLELGSNWSLSPDAGANERKLREDASRFSAILDILDSGAPNEVIVIPDTNSLVGTPEPPQYRPIAGRDNFVFLLLPTVLGELDELKNLHKNPDFREKAKKVIIRIKGWRTQGSLRDGVTVDRTITVMAIANEPDMEGALSWLDPKVRDDRILASVLEVQASHPTARVVLVTGDINLSNKAAAARIEQSDI
jgi:hypothetical protein